MSMNSGGVKLVLWTQKSRGSEMMRSCKWFPYVSKIQTLTYNWGKQHCCTEQGSPNTDNNY